MPYSNDIFVSYSRLPKWPEWVREWFIPLLEHRVATELGRKVAVFVDQDLEDGTDWPTELARQLAESRVLLPLFSRLYVNSRWCRAELSHMLAREQACGLRSSSNSAGLIVPATIHGAKQVAQMLDHRLQVSVHLEEYTAITNRASQRYEDLSERLRAWAPAIAHAIERAPTHDPDWFSLARHQFEQELIACPPPMQTSIPSMGGR